MITILLVTALLVVSSVVFHGIALENSARLLFHQHKFSFWRVGIFILVGIIAHLIEIVMFQIAYIWLVPNPDYGTIVGAEVIGWSEKFYFSAVTYTSLGFGDLTPTGDIRVLATIEALTGLIMIAWTASFAFLVMQKYWQDESHPTQQN